MHRELPIKLNKGLTEIHGKLMHANLSSSKCHLSTADNAYISKVLID
jgi:hypothetical protein